jgi:DNA-binding MarR family transcriptional regulator
MESRPALSTLLSWSLVAFTIEVDNEFESQMPHTTTMGRRRGEAGEGPWLVSLPMWSAFMQFVPTDGVAVGELEHRLFGHSDLGGRNPGMVRWGYVTLGPDPADRRPEPPVRDWLVRPTRSGRRAQEIWRPLPAATEKRWADRFGAGVMVALRRSLTALVERIDVELPDYLPSNAAYGGRAEVALRPLTVKLTDSVDLSALISKMLLIFTLDFERDAALSLVMSANPVRVLGPSSVAVSELPYRTGVAKETLSVMLGYLERHGYLAVESDARARVARLTETGRAAEGEYYERLETVENTWRSRFGSAAVTDLRQALETLVGSPVLVNSPLAAAIEPRSTGWRAKMRVPGTLPHHPVISHRGGYPDGS